MLGTFSVTRKGTEVCCNMGEMSSPGNSPHQSSVVFPSKSKNVQHPHSQAASSPYLKLALQALPAP